MHHQEILLNLFVNMLKIYLTTKKTLDLLKKQLLLKVRLWAALLYPLHLIEVLEPHTQLYLLLLFLAQNKSKVAVIELNNKNDIKTLNNKCQESIFSGGFNKNNIDFLRGDFINSTHKLWAI